MGCGIAEVYLLVYLGRTSRAAAPARLTLMLAVVWPVTDSATPVSRTSVAAVVAHA